MARYLRSGFATSRGSIRIAKTDIQGLAPNADIALNPSGSFFVTSNVVTVTNSNTGSSTSDAAVEVTGGAGITENLNVGGSLIFPSGLNNTTFGTTTPTTANFTDLTISGTTTFTRLVDIISSKTSATGVVIHDFNEANFWVHSSISANFTVNLTNVPSTNDRTLNVTLLLVQGATAYYANAFQIDGVSQTINWPGGVTPTPTANRTEIQTFSMIRTGSTWRILGSIESYGNIVGLTASNPATSAQAIKTAWPTAPSGDYWIQPTGQSSYKIYCDMTNQSGGWMLVAVGREGNGFGNGNWWNNAGSGDFANGLRQGNLRTYNLANYFPRYLPATWIRAACGGNTWNDVEMIVNRAELGDSWYYRTGTGTFNWSDFNPGGGTDSGSTASFALTVSRYSGQWLGGALDGTTTTAGWPDIDFGGNTFRRQFTWTWSGHSNSGGGVAQLNGWSTGSAIQTPGRQANLEGHSLQFVNVFVK